MTELENVVSTSEEEKVLEFIDEVDEEVLDVADEETLVVEHNIEEDIELFRQTFIEQALEILGLTEEDANKLLDLALEFRLNKDMEVYESMPMAVKSIVMGYTVDNGGTKVHYNRNAKEILENFLNLVEDHLGLNKLMIEINESIEEAKAEIGLLTDEVPNSIDSIREVMEVDNLKTADRIAEEYPERAANLRDMSAGFTDAYMYESLLEFLKKNRKARNKVLADRDSYNKFCKEYDSARERLDYNTSDLDSIRLILLDKCKDGDLPSDVTEDDIKDFLILIAKFSINLDTRQFANKVLFVYTNQHLRGLKVTGNEHSDLSMTLLYNIYTAIEALREAQANYEYMMSQRKK